MLEKKVAITDDALIIGKTKIYWGNICGLREIDTPLLKKLSNRFPRAEIILRGGRVIAVSNIDEYENQSSFIIDQKEVNYHSVIKIIKDMTPNTVLQSKSWLEWRLLLPIAIFEIFVGFWFVLNNRSFEVTVNAMIIGGISGVIVGWIWERQARKKRYS